MKNTITTLCLVVVMSGCSVTDQIEPVIPVSEEPTAVETAIGIGAAAALISAAVLMLGLAAVVNDAAD